MSGVVKMKIDKSGGIEYEHPEELKKAEDVDLVTMPPHLQNGISCMNCRFFRRVTGTVGHCGNKKVDMPVNHAQCCELYDHPGMVRSWENKII